MERDRNTFFTTVFSVTKKEHLKRSQRRDSESIFEGVSSLYTEADSDIVDVTIEYFQHNVRTKISFPEISLNTRTFLR
jgi:hypothetical protein